jgi:hypothetical protein
MGAGRLGSALAWPGKDCCEGAQSVCHIAQKLLEEVGDHSFLSQERQSFTCGPKRQNSKAGFSQFEHLLVA